MAYARTAHLGKLRFREWRRREPSTILAPRGEPPGFLHVHEMVLWRTLYVSDGHSRPDRGTLPPHSRPTHLHAQPGPEWTSAVALSRIENIRAPGSPESRAVWWAHRLWNHHRPLPTSCRWTPFSVRPVCRWWLDRSDVRADRCHRHLWRHFRAMDQWPCPCRSTPCPSPLRGGRLVSSTVLNRLLLQGRSGTIYRSVTGV